MTTLASLLQVGQVQVPIPPSGLAMLAGQVATAVRYRDRLTASATTGSLGRFDSILASITAWTLQDDDAHDTCDWDSLVACRNPLHPGPCKGWKGTLHAVAPGTYKQLEAERVRKANDRRVKRIADLKAQGKPIPRRLLEEIKPKPAPGHPAHGAQPVSLGKVNQKADLAGGQAHVAGQQVSAQAGVQVKTAPPLPLGPKGKKPTVAGRGPAFVITQPKVTDVYKLGKADKITPDEWNNLSATDRRAIRDELTAIKGRGFPPQQKKADDLLAKLPQDGLAPGTPGTVTTPKGLVVQNVSATPGKTSLGQATKTLPRPSDGSQGGPAAPSAPSATPNAPAAPSTPTRRGPDIVDQVTRAQDPANSLTPAARVFIYSKLTKADYDRLPDAAKKQLADDLDAQTSNTGQRAAADLRQKFGIKGGSGSSSNPTPAAPAPSPGPTPQAPGAPNNTPGALSPDAQYARAVAGRAVGRPTSKTHLDAYGKLTKADFDTLDAATQKTIRDDLANAKAKFLDPKKQQAAADLLNKFGAQHAPAPVAATPSTTTMTPVNVTAKIRKDGYADLVINGKTIRTGFANSSHPGTLTMAPGGGYTVTEADGTKHHFAKGQHATVATGGAPAKGYSDPMNQAVKAASDGTVSTDDLLKHVGTLSQRSIKGLDDADRKKILARLAFVATHPKASPDQKERATAYGRIINSGSPAQQGLKLDHEPSLGELHREEQKNAANAGQASAARAAAALAAAKAKSGLAPGTQTSDRVKAMVALPKGEFDALKPDEQRLILDALQDVHHENSGYSKTHDAASTAAGEAITKLTGHHPAIARAKQAEADFRAGKIDGQGLYHAILHARVQMPSAKKDDLQREELRIAEDNPTLPLWTRANLIENKYGAAGRAYDAIALAAMKHNWDDAPRLSRYDMEKIFQTSQADLNKLHPVQIAAVVGLREHVLATGLRGKPGHPGGSPWSTATRGEAVDALLGLSHGSPGVSDDKMTEFHALPTGTQALVRQALRGRLDSQTSNTAKTETWLALHQLEGRTLTDEQRAAAIAAIDTFPRSGNSDIFRKLTPDRFDELPIYVRQSIVSQLDDFQTRAARNGATLTWSPSSNALKEFPLALSAHLQGERSSYASRQARNASDIANYGSDLVLPADRVRVYGDVPVSTFNAMALRDQNKIKDDLSAIAADTSQTLAVRHQALVNHDIMLGNAPTLNAQQVSAVDMTSPSQPAADGLAFVALNNLSKADYDSLHPVYREAIDERIKGLPGSDQQVLNGKFHPAVAANNPSGLKPTAGANVPPHVQEALDTIYGVHPKSHTMAHQLKTYGALRGSDFGHLNPQEQQHLLSDLSFIHTTAKGPSQTKAKLLIDRFTPPGTPSGQVPTPAVIPPANAVPGQVRYATPIKGLAKAANSGRSGDGWLTLPGGRRVWGHYGAAGLLLKHTDPNSGEERYLMVQRGPAISDPGKWTFPGGASDSLETPHEGATRETIEELGLKDDVFKDALVHGDHTFSVPGSTWKYTTVAASVPTMIKPNLSTAHARAETSDAKWMTIAEIRALDKAGDLHAPIAKGLLEKNVISLYPQGTGVTLGQIARPGPVTKRQGRMTMPSGGRQTPANYNAWPHAHKPSKGKNLVPDKAAIDAMRQKVKQERVKYDGKTADGRLAAIGAMQGYDDTPTVMSKADVDKLLASGDYIEAWRGVQGAGGWGMRGSNRSNGKTAADINEEMRSGPAYYGKGIFGNGYYLATDKSVATQYADNTKGSIVRILIPKSALTQTYDKVEKEAQANSSRTSKAKGASSYEISTFWDPGRWGAAKGLDGIEILPHHRSGGGGASHVARPGKPAFNWLNRSVLIIQKEPG